MAVSRWLVARARLWGMNNTEQVYAEILVCPEEMQNRPESSSPWFVQDAEGEAERADAVGEMMSLVRTMAARVLTPRQKVIFRLCYQEQRTQVEIAGMLGNDSGDKRVVEFESSAPWCCRPPIARVRN